MSAGNSFSLVAGTVEAILSDSKNATGTRQDSLANPILQILSIKPIPVTDGTPRVR